MSLYPKAIETWLVDVPLGYNSNIYFVDSTNGDDDNVGDRWEKPLATILAAYNKCVAGQNDVVVLTNVASNTLSAALDWAKDYTHLVGVAAPTMVAQRSRIFQLSTLTGASPLLTISGSGCMFKNFYIFQGVDDATSLINVSVTGGRNYFENVHFAGGGHATMAIDGCASLGLDGAEENTFVKCTVGVDTISAGTGAMAMIMDGESRRNIFDSCVFQSYAGHTGAGFVEVIDATGIDRWNLFRDCAFINSNLDNFAMASGFVIPAFAANNSSRLLLKDCIVQGTTKLDADDRGVLFGNMDAVTGADLSGVAVELVT